MSIWKIAGVQMDCRLMDRDRNLAVIRSQLREAAKQGAQLVVFPECALTGYGFESKQEALPHAETVPGPSSLQLVADCRALGVWAIVGLLERDDTGGLFNACVLAGADGVAACYRKIHLPFVGVDRFATPGDRPFAVQELVNAELGTSSLELRPSKEHPSSKVQAPSSLRVGMNICYDGGFPESARILTLLGADLVVLPTNWPLKAAATPKYIVPTRAIENHIYFAAINRVGEERGFRFLGQSRIVDFQGEILAAGSGDNEEILYAEIDPGKARQKRVINVPGKYELDRIADRRPEMYAPLLERVDKELRT
jgi:predicted amidohydrolase